MIFNKLEAAITAYVWGMVCLLIYLMWRQGWFRVRDETGE